METTRKINREKRENGKSRKDWRKKNKRQYNERLKLDFATRKGDIAEAKRTHTTTSDLVFKHIKACAPLHKEIPISFIHTIRLQSIHCGKPADTIMFGAIKRFNEQQNRFGVFATYSKKEKKIVFLPIGQNRIS